MNNEENKGIDSFSAGVNYAETNGSRLKKYTGNEMNPDNQNWYELRLNGKFPDRRAYHSCFLLGKRYVHSNSKPLLKDVYFRRS